MADHGTLEIVPSSVLQNADSRHHRIILKAEPGVMGIARRLMPDHNVSPFSVVSQLDNVRLLRMLAHEYKLEVNRTDMWNELLLDADKQGDLEEDIANPVPATPSPRRFTGVLLPFQKIGLDFLLKTDGVALLADDMGLGKTVQTLAFIAQRPESMPVVIVAPLVTLQNWRREILRFLRVESPDGPAEPRVQIIRTGSGPDLAGGPADFYLINYELVHKRVDDLVGTDPRTVVFDEIQNLRNSDTRKFTMCNELAAHRTIRHRIGLSGTPIYNRGIEMFGIGEIIRPGIMGEKDWFIKEFCDSYAVRETDANMRESLSKLLQKSIMIRRRKMDVLPELPEKSRLQQALPIDSTMYESRIKKLYAKIDTAKRRMNKYKSEADRRRWLLELNKHILEMRVKERQIAGLAKAPYIVEYISKLLDDYSEEKFVVFCHHRAVHKILFDGLWKFAPQQIIGGQADRARQESIDRFQDDPECRVIICGLRAGNVGINLTSAAYVIFAEMDWSPAIHRQAEDRLHRIGQKRAVFSHYLVGLGTFDEYIADMLVSKNIEIGNVLGDSPEMTNNKKALELLEERFGSSTGLIADDLTRKISEIKDEELKDASDKAEYEMSYV